MSEATTIKHPTHTTKEASGHGSITSYTLGFVLSIVLTLAAYLLVVHHAFHGWTLIGAISVLAVAQLLVQLLFFLHLGREAKPRWNLIIFLFMLLVVLIVVIGSLWIMKNLNYHMTNMSPKQMNTYMQENEGI